MKANQPGPGWVFQRTAAVMWNAPEASSRDTFTEPSASETITRHKPSGEKVVPFVVMNI
jgi:hypothetical protein